MALETKHNILWVQLLRAMAAESVVIFHTKVILARPDYGSVTTISGLGSTGWLGVNLFFVISGFIMMHAHSRDFGMRGRVPHYAWRRFTRVYPLYWILLTAFISAAALGLGRADFKWEAIHLASAYSLLSLTDMPAMPLKVAWTLLFEVKFYIVFAALLFSRRIGWTIIGVWGAAILLRNMFTPLPDWGYLAPDWGMLSIWNINFLLGMGSWWLLRRLDDRHALPVFVAGLLMLAVTLQFVDPDMNITVLRPPVMIALGVCFALVIAGGALCERRFRWRPPAFALMLGDASYSIYLVHSAAISLLAGLHHKFLLGTAPAEVVVAATFLLASGAGIACHFLLEKPLLNMIRKVGAQRAVRRAPPAVPGVGHAS
ncbi:acyltransferase family protein [Novosphingobium soli]|uniref:Acyltransferase family protein n=1 Tax=Novosphingobium soli TaxID=574956 RepID=A0ABV6CWH2_9SPHN